VQKPCLHYEPDTITLSGQLTRRTFFGAPGFGEDPKHDEKETGYYLSLPHNVCTVATHDDEAHKGVHLVQLVLDSAGYAHLRPYIGKTVSINGTLLAATTGHHHTEVLLRVTDSTRHRR
jgi:hypothetical protein